MPITALRELGTQWRDIHAPRIADKTGPIDAFLVGQAATPQSKQRDKMIIAFVDSLQHFRPDLYSEQALRKRCLSGCGHVVVSLAFGAILASCPPISRPSATRRWFCSRSHPGIS